MKRVFTKTLLALALMSTANAGDKYNDLTEDYLYDNISNDVRNEIAKDPQTAPRILEILAKDTNPTIRANAKNNLK